MKLQVTNGIPKPGVYLLGILRDFNTPKTFIQHRKRVWYSEGTSSSKPSSRVHNSWKRHLACNTYGAANPSGLKSFEKKLRTTLLIIHESGAKTEPLKVKRSSDTSHNKSRCNISATSGLLDPHFTKGMLAWDMHCIPWQYDLILNSENRVPLLVISLSGYPLGHATI